MVQKQRNTCKVCNKRSRTEYCFTHRPRKAINKTGKHFYKWKEARQEWIANNPPSHDGTWRCELNISPWCVFRMNIDQLTIDHTIARSTAPKLRYTQSNLKPACVYCNNMKGSKTI